MEPLGRVIDQAPDAYVSVDELGRVAEWNPAATAIFGWSHDEACGRNLGDLLLSPKLAAVHRREVAEFYRTHRSPIIGRRTDVPMTTRDGRLLRVDCVVWSVRHDDGRSTLHTLLTDVTGRREAAADLRRADDDLSTFSAAMAHDLRVPLTVIKGYAELLTHEIGVEPAAAEWIERIDAAADRGVALIDDILRYLGVGRVLAVREPVDLTSLVREVVADQLAASERDAHIEVRPLPTIVGDQRLLSQLFGNLLGNALKHVPDDRQVGVIVDAAPDTTPEATAGATAGSVVVRISDNGDTIPAGDRSRIFAMFSRGVVAEPVVPGSGVGLAVSRRIAELHDGDITLEEAPGGGTRFCVHLPG